MNRIFGMAIAILSASFCFSCRSAAEKDMSVSSEPNEVVVNEALADSAMQIVQHAPQEPEKNKNPEERIIPVASIDWSKKIVKTARITVEVKEHRKYMEAIQELVRKQGGYIAQEEQTQTDYKLETIATLKVPVAQFEETMRLLDKEVVRVEEKKIQSDDVTAEFVDTRSRLESRKLVRQRYLELLKQSHKMSDILEVEQEINAIQEEIEAAAGRLNYLSQSAALSTIQLSFYQVMNADAVDNASPGFMTRLILSVKQGATGVGELFLFLVSLWPFLFFISGLVWLLRRKMKRNQPVSSNSVSV
jgi:Domain of unknown function (DUF4349)